MEPEVEIWKDVQGYEGYYQISSLGRVKSIGRLVVYKSDQSGCAYKRIREKILKPYRQPSGHLYVNLCKDSIRTRHFVHRLVLTAFVGERPEGFGSRHYPDNDPSNNKISNLQWADHHTNQLDRIAHGTTFPGSLCPSSKLKEEQVIEIREIYAKGGVTQESLGNAYGVTQPTVNNLLHRKTWKLV